MEIYVKTIVLIRLLKTIPVGNVRIVKATVTLAKHHRNVWLAKLIFICFKIHVNQTVLVDIQDWLLTVNLVILDVVFVHLLSVTVKIVLQDIIMFLVLLLVYKHVQLDSILTILIKLVLDVYLLVKHVILFQLIARHVQVEDFLGTNVIKHVLALIIYLNKSVLVVWLDVLHVHLLLFVHLVLSDISSIYLHV